MRILFVTDYFPPETNAAATRVFERARCWQEDGHEVTIVTSFPNFPQGRVYSGYGNCWYRVEDMDGIRVVRVKTFIHPNRGRFRRILDQCSFFPGAVFTAVRQDKHDVLVATSPTLFAGLAASVAAWLRKMPFVLEIGDLGAASISAVGAVRNRLLLRVVWLLESFLYWRARRVIVQTLAMKREVIAVGVPNEKITVISNGVDVERFARDLSRTTKADKDRFVVGYIGTIGMAHGLDHVLDAAEILREQRNILFVLTGDGAARAGLEKVARERQLDNVRFDGPFSHDRMPDVWGSIDLALVSLRNHPTFETVVPSKIFEAMASGVPVLLAAPRGEASELVERHAIGSVVSPEDAPALAEAVRRLAASPELLCQQAENGRAAAIQYDRVCLAERYLVVLFNAVESR